MKATSRASFFGLLGVMAGTTAITWEYLQPPFELGSEEELEMLEDIQDLMSAHPLLNVLAENPEWMKQEMHVDERDWEKDRDYHFLSRKTLRGANGVSRVRLPTRCVMPDVD